LLPEAVLGGQFTRRTDGRRQIENSSMLAWRSSLTTIYGLASSVHNGLISRLSVQARRYACQTRFYTYRAAALADVGHSITTEAPLAKSGAGDGCNAVCHTAIEIFDRCGLMN
jgi:hypothetical protein